MKRRLRAQLLRRVAADQKVRIEGGEMAAVDAGNTAWLREVVHRHGWPGHELVGVDGAHAAWLLVQHSTPDFMEQCLPLIADAVERGDASASDLAYLTDRVLVATGLPQRYGTQYGGVPLEMMDVEDPVRLDERRASVGMEPHADYDVAIRRLYGSA